MADIIKQFNWYWGENKSLIQKALTAATGSGEALIPQHLEQVITNAVPRLSPLVAMMTPKFDNQKLHEFDQLTSLPASGGAMGEGAVTPTTQPVYTRANVSLKVIRRKGATTNFLQDASKKNIDAAAANMESELLAHVYDMENYIAFGNASSNQYEFTGFDTYVTTYRTNKALGGVAPTNFTDLDTMIDANFEKQGAAHNKAFIMSPQMLSKYSALLSNVRLNQGLTGSMSQVDINGGWRLNAYRDIPIIMSSFCRPKITMGTVTPSTATTGGTIANSATNYFRVSAVTKDGESLASAETSNLATTGSSTSTFTLTWTPIADAFRYKVYFSVTSGSEVLIAVVPGYAYDANGTIAASTTNTINTTLTCTSNASSVVNTCTFTSWTPTTIPTAMQADLPLVITATYAPEYIFFIDFDEFQGLGRLPYTNQGGSQFNGLVTIEDLARTDDFLPFLIKSYAAVAPSYEATSSILRGMRVA